MITIRTRAHGDHGAALVEFALTLPLLVMFLLGMFTGGFAFNQKLAITNGVREGSRFGATLPVTSSSCGSGAGTLNCWLQQVTDVTQQASEGEVGSSVATRNICVAYVFPNGTAPNDATKKLTRTSTGDSLASGSTCFTDGRPNSERRVQVVASRQGRIEFLVATATPTLSSQSVTKFEAG
jgi:Flp pilus assembly protein TadG